MTSAIFVRLEKLWWELGWSYTFVADYSMTKAMRVNDNRVKSGEMRVPALHAMPARSVVM
jgi:hypothetical protein